MSEDVWSDGDSASPKEVAENKTSACGVGENMAYSRWGESHWYTFWCVADPGVIPDRDNAKLEVMLASTVTAAEIRADVDACVEKVRAGEQANKAVGHQGSTEDFSELRSIRLEFLADVDSEYPEAAEE